MEEGFDPADKPLMLAIQHSISTPERGVYAASSFGSPQANRFVCVRSDTEAA